MSPVGVPSSRPAHPRPPGFSGRAPSRTPTARSRARPLKSRAVRGSGGRGRPGSTPSPPPPSATHCPCSSKSSPSGRPVPFRFSRRQGASSAAPGDHVSPRGPSWSRVTPPAEGALSCPPRPPSCGGPTPGCAASRQAPQALDSPRAGLRAQSGARCWRRPSAPASLP